MPLRNYWAETVPSYTRQDLTHNAGSSIHQREYNVHIPNGAHIQKLVCSAGISIRGTSAENIQNLGMPMTWVHVVQMEEPGSDLYPSGRVVTLNKQAGELVMAQCSQKHLDPPVGDSESVWSRVVTTYSGHIQPIDQKMSYGSIDQHIGERIISARFYVYGVHGTTGNPYELTPYYIYSASMVLRVLYELMYGGPGGGS